MSSFHKGLLVLICSGILANGPLSAGQPVFYGQSAPPTITDLSLSIDGDLLGRYLDSQGKAVEGAQVTLSKDGQAIARSTTDAGGAYRFAKTPTGVYQLTVGQEAQFVRVWPRELAPPAAKPMLSTIRQEQVLRGQFGGGGMDLGLLIGVAGLTVGTIALIEVEETKDEVSELRQQMTTMTTTVVSP